MAAWTRISEGIPENGDNVLVITSSCSESNCTFKNGEFWHVDVIIPKNMIVSWKKISNVRDYSDIPVHKCRTCGGI